MGKKKRLLVVGGTGFLGKHILEKSINLGFKTVSASLHLTNISKRVKGVKYLKVDIRYKRELLKLKQNYDYVVNVSGYGGYENKNKILFKKDAQYYGLKNLAGYFLKKKIKKFIQIGTSLEYGDNKSPLIESMSATSPINDYGMLKLYATNYLRFLHNFYKFPSVILRLFQVYGPKQEKNRLIGYILNSIRKNKSIYVSKGNQIRDFLYVSDFVDALFLTLKTKKTSGQIINIGYGYGHKIKYVTEKIFNNFRNKKLKIKIKKSRKNELKVIVPSIKKAKKLIKWEPQISLLEGLKKTINHNE